MKDNGITTVRIGSPDSTASEWGIYKIECNGKVYVGQSTQLTHRLFTHCSNAYALVSKDLVERIDDEDLAGSNAVYYEMAKAGLSNTIITVYLKENNYGIPQAVFDDFERQWAPNNTSVEPNRRKLDIAEIIHIYANAGPGLTNQDMGGTSGGVGSLYYRGDASKSTVLTVHTSPAQAKRFFDAKQQDVVHVARVVHSAQDTILDDVLWDEFCKKYPNDTKGLEETFSEFLEKHDKDIFDSLMKQIKKWVDADTRVTKSQLEQRTGNLSRLINQFIRPRLEVYKKITSSEGELIVENLFPDSMGRYIASVLMNMASKMGQEFKKNGKFSADIDYEDSVRQVRTRGAGHRIKSLMSLNDLFSLQPQQNVSQGDWRKNIHNLQGAVETKHVVEIKKYISFRLFQKALKSIPSILEESAYNNSLSIQEIPDVGMAFVVHMGELATLQSKIYSSSIKLVNIESIGSHQNEYYVACIKMWRYHKNIRNIYGGDRAYTRTFINDFPRMEDVDELNSKFLWLSYKGSFFSHLDKMTDALFKNLQYY